MQARAIASSSLVGITSTVVGDRSDEILRGPVAGAVFQEVIDVLAVANALRVALPPRTLTDY